MRYPVDLFGKKAYVLVEDASISLTYARNLADGHGLVWSVGQHPVEGYSNFLWTLWMAAIEAAHPSDQMAGFWVMLSGAVLLAANAYVITRIARRLMPQFRILPIIAGLAASLYYPLNSWTLAGMETGLVALLCSLGVLTVLRSCDPRTDARVSVRLQLMAGILLALGVLTRDDVIIVAGIVVAFAALRSSVRMRAAMLVGGPVILAEVGHIAFRLAYYGYPFPNTYYLKVSGIPEGVKLHRGMIDLAQSGTMQLVLPAALAVTYFVLTRRSGRRPAVGSGLLAAIVTAQAAYMVLVGGDSYAFSMSDRYLDPLVPLLFILAFLGAAEVARSLRTARAPLFVVGSVVLAGAVLTWAQWLPVAELQQTVIPRWHLTPWVVVLGSIGLLLVVASLSTRIRGQTGLATGCSDRFGGDAHDGSRPV